MKFTDCVETWKLSAGTLLHCYRIKSVCFIGVISGCLNLNLFPRLATLCSREVASFTHQFSYCSYSTAVTARLKEEYEEPKCVSGNINIKLMLRVH